MKVTIQYLLGFSLIEVLISLCLLSLILMSFQAMEMYALRQYHQAYLFSVATQQFSCITERLRARKSLNGLADQVALWNQQNKVILPNAEGSVNGRYPNFTITLHWGLPTAKCNIATATCLQQVIKL